MFAYGIYSVPHPTPPESESRMLDKRVQQEEMPYGYLISPPPADSGDFDTKAKEEKYHH